MFGYNCFVHFDRISQHSHIMKSNLSFVSDPSYGVGAVGSAVL